nr:MAG TPA: hypothetical protein [Caudoviricetes sp.]
MIELKMPKINYLKLLKVHIWLEERRVRAGTNEMKTLNVIDDLARAFADCSGETRATGCALEDKRNENAR